MWPRGPYGAQVWSTGWNESFYHIVFPVFIKRAMLNGFEKVQPAAGTASITPPQAHLCSSRHLRRPHFRQRTPAGSRRLSRSSVCTSSGMQGPDWWSRLSSATVVVIFTLVWVVNSARKYHLLMKVLLASPLRKSV